jgi:hypothetical protein
MGSLRRFGAFVYRWWMKFAVALAFVNARVLLTLVYFLLIGPTSLVLRLLGKDFLDRKNKPSASFWKAKEPRVHSLEESKRQF